MFYDNNDDLEPIINPTKIGYRSKEDPLNGISGFLALLACLFLTSIFWGITPFLNMLKQVSFSVPLFLLYGLCILLNAFLLILMFKRVYFFSPVAFWCILIDGFLSVIQTIVLGIEWVTFFVVANTVVWCIYLKKSQRVKRTFIYTWQGKKVDKDGDSSCQEKSKLE